MGRAPCCDKANVKRGSWSPEEDATLKSYLETYGTGGNWIALPRKAGLKRCGKSCRLRWLNYLRPDIKHGGFTEEEDNIICSLYTQMGSRWSAIASQLPGRTDNDVKNYWNTKLKKKLIAGKVTLTQKNETTLPSPLTQNANNTHQNSDFPSSQNQDSPKPSIHQTLKNDASSGFNIKEENLNFGLIHEAMNDVLASSEIGESSSISDSSSIPFGYNNCVSLPDNDESKDQALMDFGFGFPYYDLVNGFNFHDQRFGEFVTTSYSNPELVDFGYADIKPH